MPRIPIRICDDESICVALLDPMYLPAGSFDSFLGKSPYRLQWVRKIISNHFLALMGEDLVSALAVAWEERAKVSLAGDFLSAENTGAWKQTLDINLKAQISGTLLAARAMERSKSRGDIPELSPSS